MISEAVAALIVGVFTYMVGDGNGHQRGRLQGRGEAHAEWSHKYDELVKRMAEELEKVNFQLTLKVYIAARDAFFLKIKGRPFSQCCTVYSADFRSHGQEDYSENFITFPDETGAHLYGKSKLTGKFSFADYRVAARPGFPNALAGNGTWLFCLPGGDYDMYVRRNGENDWVPRIDFPLSWTVKGHTNLRFQTNEEAYLYTGYLKLNSKQFQDSTEVIESDERPNVEFFGLRLERLNDGVSSNNCQTHDPAGTARHQ